MLTIQNIKNLPEKIKQIVESYWLISLDVDSLLLYLTPR
jgi:hypothetical protein